MSYTLGEYGIDGEIAREQIQRNFLTGAVGQGAAVRRGDFHLAEVRIDHPELLCSVLLAQLLLLVDLGDGVGGRKHLDDDIRRAANIVFGASLLESLGG